ncbi:hypothetical protein BG003_008780, partial [Podila horticola]
MQQILAVRLNILEWKYEIRSSTFIYTFELYSVLAALMALYSLYTQDQSNQDSFRTLIYYLAAILIAFVFEAFPRGSTHVQKQSGANPHDKANIFSRWTFHYLQPIISLGYKRPLVQEDIKDVLPKALEVQPNYQKLSVNWEAHKRAIEHANATASSEQLKKKGLQKPSFIYVITKTYTSEFVSMLALKLLASASQFIFPVLVSEMLKYVESEMEEPISRGVTLALAMFLASILVPFATGQFYKKEIETGLRVRGALISMVYRKALLLAPSSRGSIGEATNHMSSDVERWPDNLAWMVNWISIPFEVIVCTVMLYNVMGWSALCGLACILLSAPIQAWVGEFLDTAREAKMGAVDSRIQLMTEVLGNIKIIKLYAYEEGFRSKIQAFRNEELSIMRKSGQVVAVLSLVYTCFPFLMAFISFAVYATIGGPNFTPGEINSQVVFVSMTLFGMLNRPVGSMSQVIEATVSIRVATRRIQKFLLKEELDPRNVERESTLPKDPSTPVIVIEDATFAWKTEKGTSDESNEDKDEDEEANETTALLSNSSEQTNEPTLTNVNIEIVRGHLTAVVGRVGQGKSSLL